MNGTTITVAGNIATTPEERSTAAGVTYTRFRLACSERRRDKTTGEWVDAGTNWYTVSVFRTLGENAARSLKRGERVLLTGRLRIRDWETAQNHGTEAEIDAEAIGHDLRWGTTSFAKTSPADSAQAPGSEWTAPGTSPAQSASEGERSPVPVGASGDPILGTPY